MTWMIEFSRLAVAGDHLAGGFELPSWEVESCNSRVVITPRFALFDLFDGAFHHTSWR